jgi:hypothetical protein
LDPGRKRFVLLDEKRELVDDDDGVLFAQCFEERFPIAADIAQRGELCGSDIYELFELVRCRRLDRLVVDGVVPIRDGLADEFAFSEAAAVDYDKVCRLGFVAVRQLIEFDVPINEVHHRSSTVSTQIELSILEIAISEFVISYLEPD